MSYKNPMKLPVAQLFAVAALMLAGCSSMTSEKIDSYAEIAKAYYAHDDSTKCIRVTGTATNPATFCMTGIEIEIRMPTQPKTIIPREPSTMSGIVDAVKTIAPYALLYGLASEGVFGDSGSSSTSSSVNNYSGSATP